MFISFLAIQFGNDEVLHMLEFSGNTLFFVCLPPIIFASGFNMQ